MTKLQLRSNDRHFKEQHTQKPKLGLICVSGNKYMNIIYQIRHPSKKA
jgi:hypothetical protein